MPDLSGKKVVVTGTLQTMKRAEAKKRLTALGAKVTGSVSAATDLLIYGDAAGSKLERARQYGVAAAGERELLALLGESLSPPELEGPLADYVQRFEAMVAELEAHPDVHVVNAYVGMPLSEADIAKREVRWGGPLSPALRNLYRQANGLTLLWIRKDSESYEERRHRRRHGRLSWSTVYDDDGRCEGALCLLPLDELLFHSWKGHHWFDWMKDSERETFGGEDWGQLELHRAIHIFDYFNFYNAAGLVMRDGEPEGAVVIGDDHCACWTDSKRVSFETYMEGQLLSYARVQARRAALKEMFGHRGPMVTEWPAEPLPATSGGGASARRVWYATVEGSFKRDGEGWTRVGDGLAVPFAEKGRAQQLKGLAFDSDGAVVIATERSLWRLSLEGGEPERVCGGPQSAFSCGLAAGPDGALALGLTDRVLVHRPGQKLQTVKKKALGGEWPSALAFEPGGALWVGLHHGLLDVPVAGEPTLEPVAVPKSGVSGESWDFLESGPDGALMATHKGHVLRRDPGGPLRSDAVRSSLYYTALVEITGLGLLLVAWGADGAVLLQRAPGEPFEAWEAAASVAGARPSGAVADGQGGAILFLLDGSLARATAEGVTRIPWASESPSGLALKPNARPYDAAVMGPGGRLWLRSGRFMVAVELG